MKSDGAACSSSALILFLVVSGLTGPVAADEGRRSTAGGLEDVAPVNDPVYRRVCGRCHVAYPAGLLPARSWEKLMSGLGQHFGVSVDLSRGERARIYGYLLNGAAGRVPYRVSREIMESLAGKAPLRVTEVPYIRAAHRALREDASEPLWRCEACHPRLPDGYFDSR